MTTAARTHSIATAEYELLARERAAAHLRGIPARQNATAIARLYDTLAGLHLDRLEQVYSGVEL